MKTKIIYEDSEVFVVYKPAGLATEASGSFQMDVISELKNNLKQPNPYVAMIHRLDQPVEGLLVFAKTKSAAAKLSKQLQENVLKKNYVAVVAYDSMKFGKNGHAKELLPSSKELFPALKEIESCHLENYLIKDHKNSMALVVDEKTPDAKIAKLAFQVDQITKISDDSLVEKLPGDAAIARVSVQIDTGRFHQIRCQMAHFGLPLLGDQKYKNDVSELISREMNVRHVALCANEISFVHPKTNEQMTFTVEPKNKAFKLIH